MDQETEREITNQDIVDAINSLTESQTATNVSVKELTEYLIVKEKRDQQAAETKAKQEEQEAKKQAELDEQNAKEAESAEAEQTASAQAQTETYTELLTNIDEGIRLNNQLQVINGIYIGIVVGLLFMKILFDRIFK